jgi:microcystin degradation protein MlrC
VKSITDGKFVNRPGAMFAGVRFDLGAMCRLVIEGVDVIVASRAEQIYDVEPFALHGLDVTGHQLIALKGANHFRAYYRTLAKEIISVDSVGLSTADITSFARERLQGQYWPLSDKAQFQRD